MAWPSRRSCARAAAAAAAAWFQCDLFLFHIQMFHRRTRRMHVMHRPEQVAGEVDAGPRAKEAVLETDDFSSDQRCKQFV
eukprot:6463153-Amphidinium_carterae.1